MQNVAAIRFPRLNLKRNPFGELTADARSQLAVCQVTELLAWQRKGTSGRRVVQFIGPCGHGKSSHLLACRGELSDSVVLRIPPCRPWPTIPDHGLLLVDEADRAPRSMLRKLLTNDRLVAVGVHRDLSKHCHRYGLETQTVEVSLAGDSAKLSRILNQRIAAAKADPEKPSLEITVRQAERLQRRYGNDVRAIEDFLYLQIQKLGDGSGDEVQLDF